METTGVLNDCYKPDSKKNNILFDSCVYDKRLLENSMDVNKLKSAKKLDIFILRQQCKKEKYTDFLIEI